jgi:hypothetical protein
MPKIGFHFVKLILLLLAITGLLLAACSQQRSAVQSIKAGMTQSQVEAVLGDPDFTQLFVLPEDPFFGPQEGLIGDLPTGTEVEEWRYQQGEEILYLWFVAGSGTQASERKLFATASYPADARY